MRYALCYIVLFLAPFCCRAQQFFLKNYGVDEGLPSNEVHQVFEDASGFLWIATDRGIVRFDGHTFEQVYLNNQQVSPPAFGIFKGTGGRLYFSGLKGHLYIYENGGLRNYPFNAALERRHKQDRLLVANSVAENGQKLLVNYGMQPYSHIQSDGSIVADSSIGFYYNMQTRFFHYLKKNNGKDAKDQFTVVWENGTKTTVTCAFGSGNNFNKILHAKVGNNDVFSISRKIFLFKNHKLSGSYNLPNDIFSIHALGDSQLITGLEHGGAKIYSLNEKGLTLSSSFLEGLSVSSIHRDFQGGLWFSTLENGLYYAYPSAAVVWSKTSRIHSVLRSNNKAVIFYEKGDIEIYQYGKPVQALSANLAKDDKIRNCGVDKNGIPHIITNAGVYSFAGNKWLHKHDDNNRQMARSDTLSYFVDNMNSVIACNNNDAFYIWMQQQKLTSAAFYNGRLWVGTITGLYEYDGKKFSSIGSINSQFNDRIIAIGNMHGDKIAVATFNNGLLVYDGKQSFVLDRSNGLESQVINHIQVTEDSIWLSTNKGLSKVVFYNGTFDVTYYDSRFGLPTVDIHNFCVAGNYLYLKWVNRIITINLALLNNPLSPKGPFLTSILINGKPEKLTPKATFKHFEKEVTLTFNSINYANGDKQLFRYRLLGLDKSWHTTTERRVTFNNLMPGKYSLELQAANAWGIFPANPVFYSFEIQPAFWQHWWFYILCSLLLALVISLLFLARLRAVKRRNQLLLDLAESQQRAMVQLANPHFIFNVLNTAQAAILKEDKMNATSIISRFAKLMRLSLELNHEKYVALEKEIELLRKYLDLEAIRFPERFSSELKIDEHLDIEGVKIPSMLIQPFVENSIKHGLSHKQDDDRWVSIRFEMKEEQLLCVVEDNGIGRKSADLINENRLQKHNSVGIEITRKRLILLHKEQRTRYMYEVEDKCEDDGTATGTKVSLLLPYLKANESYKGSNN